DCAVCGVKLCYHFEGQECSGSKKNLDSDKLTTHDYRLLPKPKENKNSQLTDKEKSQLLSLFQKYNIKKITSDNGKLVIKYNNSRTENKQADKQELEKYQKFIQNLPNHSISLSDLQTNANYNKNPNDNKLAIGLVAVDVGIVILAAIVVYFSPRKKKVK